MARINVEYEVANGEVQADVRIYPNRRVSMDMERFLNTDARQSVGNKFGYDCYWSYPNNQYVFKRTYLHPAVSWDSVRDIIKKQARALLLHLGTALSESTPLILPPSQEEFELEDPICREAEEE